MTPEQADKDTNYSKVQGLDDYYVDKQGNVYGIANGLLRKLRQHINYEGYYIVKLHKSNNHGLFKVHRLVASAFIPNPLNKSDVHHIDENKQNNTVENLAWVTHLENMRAGTQIQRRSKPVVLTSIADGSKLYYKSTMDARRDGYGVDKVLGGRQKTTKGYTVELDDPNKYL